MKGVQNEDNSRPVRVRNPPSLHTPQEATGGLLHLNRQLSRGGGSPAQEGRSPARGGGWVECPRSSQGTEPADPEVAPRLTDSWTRAAAHATHRKLSDRQ